MPRNQVKNIANGSKPEPTVINGAIGHAIDSARRDVQQHAASHAPVVPVKSQAELLAEIDRLKAENEAIRRVQERAARAGLTLKISEKGALSVYGLGRFPATFYREQWEKLLGFGDEIKAYILANDSKLKRKDQD